LASGVEFREQTRHAFRGGYVAPRIGVNVTERGADLRNVGA
jgi:hypothetical protein